MCANNGKGDRDEESTTSLIGGVTNVLREEVIELTHREEVGDAGSDLRWTLAEYRQECRGLMDVGCFSAMAVDRGNLVMYDRNNFQWDTALSDWKRRWAVSRKWFAVVFIIARFTDMPFIRCQQEVPYCWGLRDAIDAGMVFKDGDPQLGCWLFDKSYTNNYLLHGGSHQTRTLEFEA